MWQPHEAIADWIVTGIGLVDAVAKGVALWFVPFAVVAYVVMYFVMAIIPMIFWAKGRDPRIRPFWQNRWGNESS
jgi:hypothetical protein